MGLYERLLREAAELPEDPNRARHQRMSAYVGSRRKAVPEGGGYITSEELQEEQERYLGEIGNLCGLLINGPGGVAGGYWLAHLKSKYPTEYTRLRAIKEGYS